MFLIDVIFVYVHLYVITYQLGFKPNDELNKVPYALSDYYLIRMEMIKPVYLRDNDIQSDKKNIVRDFEISISVSKCIDDLKCVQKDRDLWRLYVGSIDSRHKLLCEGFELRNLSVKAFDINPFSAGIHHQNERVLRVTVKGVPLSVDDGEITKMLEKFNVHFTRGIKYEKIRDPETKKMTRILNGNRFVYVIQLEEGAKRSLFLYCHACSLYRVELIVQFPRGVRLKCYYAIFLVCCGCDTSYKVSVHIQCQAYIYTLLLCRRDSWRMRLAKQETLAPPGTWSRFWFAGSVNVHRGALLLVPQ